MKKLLILPVLLFSIIFSSTSFAGWTLITDDTAGNDYYIDFAKIKKIDGYYSYRWLVDLLKPDNEGDASYISYTQVDCKFSRNMTLSEFYYTQPMGEGRLTTNKNTNPEWTYPAPGSMTESMLEEVCDYVK